jgi:hypothetical protein
LAEEKKAPAVPEIDVERERKKARVVCFVFFDFANVTEDNKPNLIGIFDRVLSPAEEKKTPPLGFFLRVHNVISGKLRVAIYAPSGKITGGFTTVLDEQRMVEEKLVNAQIIGNLSFEIPEDGNYWLAVFHDEELVGGTRLTVLHQPPEEEKHDDASGAPPV